MSEVTNIYATAARLTKAHKLASHLHRHHINAEEAKLMSNLEWEVLAGFVGVNKPSYETIDVTIQMLADLEHYGEPDGPVDGGEHDWNTEAADVAYRRDMKDAGRGRLLR